MKNTTATIDFEGTFPENVDGQRLDQALASLLPQYSRSKIKTWIDSGEIYLNGQTAKPREKVKTGDTFSLHAQKAVPANWDPEAIALTIVYEDEDLLIVNKPAGLVVHPGAGNAEHTLVNALVHYHPPLAELPRAGLIHRIDKNTSGLLIVAKSLPAYTELIRMMQARTIKREYEALVTGMMTSGGTVDEPIGRHPQKRTHMAVHEAGKPAITHYRVITRFAGHTHLRLQLETGRTHQIRVHMAHIGFPIVGDKTYGGRLKLPANISAELREAIKTFPRQALHAKKLSLIHPLSKEPIEAMAPLPEDIETLLGLLKKG